MQEHELIGDMLEIMQGCFFGKYRGMVTNHLDPTGRGRIEVLVPAVMGEQPVWALACAPYAGDNMGVYMVPEPGSGVWVEFEAGDPSYPIWVGCFWGDNEAPKNERGTKVAPGLKIIRSQQGLMVTLDDQQQVITLSDKDGNNLVTIAVEQGRVTVKGAQKVVVEAPQIELVENAAHPVVFGDKLLQYLGRLVAAYQTHTHTPSPPSPPSTPFPPATPDLISTKVRTG
jgi:uncharacterized protein involved in type VI secretion and phage assembly